MKKILMVLPLCIALTHSAYAGFSIGMPGAVIKHVQKLDDKVKEKKLSMQENAWVLVPGNLSLGTSNFYVMKYEAKNVGGMATSQADITPWLSIDHPSAVAACAALGSGSHLLTIAEAQTINRNIEAQTANWANGVIGSLVSAGGGLKRGNVGITDSASYDGADPEFGAGRNAKAKLVLSNGGEIWDWSGNVWEWIYGAGANGTLGTPSGVTFDAGGWYEWNSTSSPDLNQERPILGPSNSSWTGAYGVGQYYGGVTTNAVKRGGSWDNAGGAGVFTFWAEQPPSAGGGGFRCGRATTYPDTQSPTVPTNLTATAVSNTQIDLSWTASIDNVGVTSYKLYRDGGATPIATPTGTTYSNTGLTASTAYSYTVSACDTAGNCSAQSAADSTTTSAPPTAGGEWIFVPGNSSLGTNDFFIMKYEAKNVGGIATSQAAVTPWVNINQPDSIAACSALGSGYHLPTIAETQTINRNIEAQAANWANGTIGSLISAGGGLKRGNINLTDSVSYSGGAAEYGVRSAAAIEKAKLVLSNGGEIWDWSGNVLEWIYGAGANGMLGTPNGITFYSAVYGWHEWNEANLTPQRPVLGPSNAAWNTNNGIGACGSLTTTNAPYHGGSYDGGYIGGVYSVWELVGGQTGSGSTLGFRCVAPPTAGGEWVFVPGNLSLGTSDFYVMKYEAKNVGSVATSTAGVTPWVNITQAESITACSALGSGSHLLTIPETQTINRNIEAQTANWADNPIGSLVSAGGGLKRGNVNITDSASYIGATPEFGTGRNVKAKLVFSNGGEIWDWSGNVWEWIYGADTNGKLGTPAGVTFDGGNLEWNSPNLSQERPILGPSNSSWTGDYGVGSYAGGATTSEGRRGGSWGGGATAGVFNFFVDNANPPSTASYIGFRCGR